jgi:hypothetical protein
MAVPTAITDLSITAASNGPAGTDSITSSTGPDDYIRAIAALLRREQAKGANVASATTVDLGAIADGNYVHITGTTTITGFGTVAAGIERTLVFDGALVLTHNGTSLILPNAANITTIAGDVGVFVSEGSGNWRCKSYTTADALGTIIAASTDKATPVNADMFGIADSAASNATKKLTWANVKATLKAYFDTLYAPTGSNLIAQRVSSATGASSTGTTVIPSDDTIPQNTEGTEFMTLAITPENASSTLEIEVTWIGANSAASAYWMTVALFQDATAGALAVVTKTVSASNYIETLTMKYSMTAGTTSATTFKVRAGADLAGTTTFNGATGTRRFGGVLASSITIIEYLP